MSDDDEMEEVIEEQTKDDTPITPLEVKVVNQPSKPEPSDFDSTDDAEYENMYPTKEQIKEYEDEE